MTASARSPGGEAMGMVYQDHVAWYQSGRFRPYLRSYRLPSPGVSMLEAHQPALDASDPATRSMTVAFVQGPTRFRSDMGAGAFRSQGVPHETVLIRPGIATKSFVEDPHTVRFLSMDANLVHQVLAAERVGEDPLDFGRLHATSFVNETVCSTIDRLWIDAEGGGPTVRLQADGAVLVVLAALLQEARRPVRPHKSGLAPWQVRRVCEIMAAKMPEQVSLEALAAAVGLSPFHFARAFKVSKGVPPHAWQVTLRMERAKELLDRGEQSITTIALEVGYESGQALARQFRRSFGVSPTAWRRDRRG